MPFAESSRSLRSKLHLTEVSMPVLVGILVLAVLAGVLAVQNVVSAVTEPAFTIQEASDSAATGENANDASGSDSEDNDEAPQKSVVVFVSGAVALPGVYELPEGSRVSDAVNAAGGFTDGAATDAVNLARVLSDGEQIAIVTQESIDSAAQAQGAQDATAQSAAVSATGTAASASPTGLVNINTADQTALETLPGIGTSTAQKIIADRDKEGPFTSKEDIKRVSGIGEKKYEAIADLITV